MSGPESLFVNMLLTVPDTASYFRVPGAVTEATGTGKTSLMCFGFPQVDWAEGCDIQNSGGCLFNVHLTSLLIGSDGSVLYLTVWPTQVLLNRLHPEREEKAGHYWF